MYTKKQKWFVKFIAIFGAFARRQPAHSYAVAGGEHRGQALKVHPDTFQNTPTPNFGVGDEWKVWIFPQGLPLHQNWCWGLIPGGEGVWIYLILAKNSSFAIDFFCRSAIIKIQSIKQYSLHPNNEGFFIKNTKILKKTKTQIKYGKYPI